MEITDFIVNGRADALLVGNYNSYRAQLTRRLHSLRKRLGRTTPKGKKYKAKDPVRAEDVGENAEFVRLLLVTADRAWATAMNMKSVSSSDTTTRGGQGSTRRHIISRLNKATTHAKQLVAVLEDRETSHASLVDLLEARAYLASLCGAFWMEKQRWTDCIRQYSIARVLYSSLERQSSRQVLRDVLSSTIDPSIRYAAYQLGLPRSTPVPTIAAQYFPTGSRVSEEVEAVNTEHVKAGPNDSQMVVDSTPENLPQTISWRSRTVPLEDASISQALANASAAETQLTSWLSSADGQSSSAKEIAGNYDNVIIASQDAVDATKTAIDDLLGEGVDQSDKRMQSLQVTRTAVNYALVEWRVGRNRVLCGSADGLHLESGKRKKRGQQQQTSRASEEQSTGKQLSQLRECVVLYDAILQSLDSVQELPGVAGDASFVEELNGKRRYFQSLRCLAIARSHAALSNARNALALFARASDLVPQKPPSEHDTNSSGSARPLRLEVSSSQLQAVASVLQGLVWQYRGMVEVDRLSAEREKGETAVQPPMIERLDDYPHGDCDLANLVAYPPKAQPIPVKPLFLDVAFNYIDYPRASKKSLTTSQEERQEGPAPATEAKKEAKRSWFGFGR